MCFIFYFSLSLFSREGGGGRVVVEGAMWLMVDEVATHGGPLVNDNHCH